MLTCRVCGHANPDDEKFCQGCSRFLEFTADPVAPTPGVGSIQNNGPGSSTPAFGGPAPGYGEAQDPVRLGSQAEVPTRPQPVVPAFGTGRSPGNSFPQVPDAGPELPSGMRPSDVAERPTYRPPPVSEQEVIRPGDLVCGACRAGNGPERTFCRRCGNQLRQEAVAPIYVPPPPARAFPTRLVVAGIGVLLAAVAAFAGYKVFSGRDTAKTVTSTTSKPGTTTASVTPATPTVPPGAAAAPCPTAAVLNEVAKRPNTAFAVEGVPSEPGEVILQFAVASAPAPSKSLVITICRTPGEVYHYFSRDNGGAPYGVYSTATNLGPAGFKALYPNSADSYVINGDGVTTSANVNLKPTEIRCANLVVLNPAWKGFAASAPACTPASAPAWKV